MVKEQTVWLCKRGTNLVMIGVLEMIHPTRLLQNHLIIDVDEFPLRNGQKIPFQGPDSQMNGFLHI